MSKNYFTTVRVAELLMFAAILLGYGLFTHTDHLGRLDGDNAYYLLMAQYFAQGAQASAAAQAIFDQAFYPPLYPLWLALWGGGLSLPMAHFSTVLYLWLALAVWWFWARLLGSSRIVCAALVVFIVFIPGMLLHSLEVLSEFMYLFFSMIGLYAAERWRRKPHGYWLLLASGAVACALLTRSVGIALWLGYALWLWGQRSALGYRHVFLLLVTPLLPSLAWTRLHTVQDNYFVQFIERLDSFAALFAQLRGQLYSLYVGWLENFSSAFNWHWIFFGLGLFCVMAALWRAWMKHWDGYYVIAYLLVLVAWPFPGESPRFLLAVMPVMLWQAVALVSHFTGHGWRLRRLTVLLFGLVLLASESMPILHRAMHPPPVDLAEFHRHADWMEFAPEQALPLLRNQQTFERMLIDWGTTVSHHDCIYSPKPSISSWMAGRPSMRPPRLHVADTAFHNWVDANPCRYTLSLAHETPSFPSDYPARRFAKSHVVAQSPTAKILEIDAYR